MQKSPSNQAFTSPVSSNSLKTKHVVIFLTICAAISFGSTTYLFVAGKKDANPPPQPLMVTQSSPQSRPTPTPTPVVKELTEEEAMLAEPTPDPTATWSAYVNAKYHYSLKYPADWTVKKLTSTDPKITNYVVFYPKNASGSAYAASISYSTRTYSEALAIDSGVAGESAQVSSISATKKKIQDSARTTSFKLIIPYKINFSIILYAKGAYEAIFNGMVSTFEII